MASPTFSASLDAGRQLFEKGAFHDAHEAWESGWRRTRGAERQVLQVLVLWAAALHHHRHGKELGANRLLLRAMERLGELDLDLDGIDLEGLREGLVTSLEHARLPWSDAAQPAWPPSLVSSMNEQLEHEARCPYCGEPVLVNVAPEEAEDASYVEDCPVCCRPWQVQLTRDGDALRVTLGRDDAQ
jgi:predicted metal-dependent hydrolase/DNA-directed RNA polymerase subunit RPC12/RpoP